MFYFQWFVTFWIYWTQNKCKSIQNLKILNFIGYVSKFFTIHVNSSILTKDVTNIWQMLPNMLKPTLACNWQSKTNFSFPILGLWM